MALKALISSPLEAGTSILDAHRLPPHLTPALEYTSKRLARKGLHVTLVVARRDYQLPGCPARNEVSTISATDNPVTNLPTPPASPASLDQVSCAPGFTAFKSLVRSGTDTNLGGTDTSSMKPPQRSMTASLPKKASLASLFDSGLGSPRLRWPLTPKTPACTPLTPRTPATPATPASSITTASSTTAYSSAGGASLTPSSNIRLIYTTPLDPRADKLVRSTLARATRKFGLGASLTARDAATYNMQPDVLHRSILQNEFLLRTEGLTLLSLDHLYTFKSALAHYSAGTSELGSDFRLEDAVDELRRCILSSAGGRLKLPKSVLVGTYEWLGPVDEAALGDIMRMYCRAYGGLTGDTGVEDDLCKAAGKTLRGEVVRPIALTPPPKSRLRMAKAVATPTTPLPLSAASQSQSPRNWVVEGSSSLVNDGMVTVVETLQVKDDRLTPFEERKKSLDEAEQLGNDQAPIAQKASPKTVLGVAEKQGLPTPQITPVALSGSPPKLARASPKASLPTLKLQTSFQTPPKPPPKRKTTPMPKRVSPREQKEPATPPSPQDDLAIVLHADDDVDDDGDATDFEDGDLTARPPPSAVRAFWPGGSIDEILGDRQRGGQSSFGHHRRSSSLGLSPLQQHEGPTTPNGYEDISPITRGEWGFLMVSDPFKTKTAAVETF